MKKSFVAIAVAVLLLSWSVALFAQSSDEKGVVNLQKVSVPRVVSMLGGEAKSELRTAGLVGVYAGQMVPASSVSMNAKVAAQSPTAGTLVARGTTVTLTLYKFVEPVGPSDEKGVVNPLR